MIRKAQKELHGVKATIFTCPKCYYQYEKGIRYNRAIKQYFSYYKFSWVLILFKKNLWYPLFILNGLSGWLKKHSGQCIEKILLSQNSMTFSLEIEGLSRQNSSNFNGFLQSTQNLICMNYIDNMDTFIHKRELIFWTYYKSHQLYKK